MRWIFWGLCSVALLLSSACGALESDDGGDEVLPTRAELTTEQVAPTEDEEPSPTAETLETEVPTATPGQRTRPTLPPTWTPTPLPATSTATATVTATSTRVPVQPLEACETFAVDFENTTRQFTLGESPTIAWTPVEGAELYRLYIYADNQARVYYWLHDSNVYEIPAEVFTHAGRFAWEIEPLDPAGIQMCYSRGEMLVANEN